MLTAHWTENIRGLKGLAQRFALGDALSPEEILVHANRGSIGSTSTDPHELAARVVSGQGWSRAAPDEPTTARPSPFEELGDPQPIWPPRPEELLQLLYEAKWNVKGCAERLGRRRETVARLMRQHFGEGGKLTAQRAFRVWRASQRVPSAAQLDTVFALYFENAPESPEAKAAMKRWSAEGRLPDAP